MANVLVEESYLQDIADEIRAKTGGSGTYTPAQMGPAIAALTGSAPTLGTKTITYNGTFRAEDDGLDGWSSVVVSRDPEMHPIAYDITPARVGGTNLYVDSTASGYMTDVYAVENKHTYKIGVGSTRGNRFDVSFYPTNPADATSNLSGGTQIDSVASPGSKYSTTWKATSNGYIAITKTSTGATGYKTYVFDMTLTEDL